MLLNLNKQVVFMALTIEFVVKVTVFSPNCLNMTPCDVCGFAHMGTPI